MKKKVFCMIAALFTMMTGMYAQTDEQTDEPVTSGLCGECTWSYDTETKTLTISPTAAGGRMADYEDLQEIIETDVTELDRPWKAFNKEAENLVIEEGVTYIGQSSLAAMPFKDEIVIPNSVEEIGKYAFFCNFGVRQKIIIGDGVTKIGDYAFWFVAPAQIIVGSKVNYIGKDAFSFIETTMTCKGEPFETWVDPPSPEYTLKNTDCHFVVNLDDWEKWITAYPGLANWIQCTSEKQEWTSGACTVTLNTDNTITVSGNGAMDDYASMDLVPWKEYSRRVRKVTFEDGVTSIGRNAFADCKTVVDVYINGDLTTWEGAATDFWENTTFHFMKDGQWIKLFPALLDRQSVIPCGGGIVWSYDKENKTLKFEHSDIEGDARMNNYENNDDGRASWYPLHDVVNTVRFGWDIKYIGAYAFHNFTDLTTVELPIRLENCGEGAFQYTSIERFEIPATMTTIPARMFNMAHLEEVVIPEGVTHIGEKAFQFCSHLGKLYLPKSLTFIGADAFTRGLDDEVDVYVYSANPGGITWESELTDFGSKTRFHVLAGQAALWKECHPNAQVQFIEDNFTEALPFEMKSADDWRFLCDVVNNGAQGIYAKLANDIDLGTCNHFVGTQDHPFNGQFDGQGHTLNVNYDEATSASNNYRAPFRHINSATIRNLRVTGRHRNYTTREGSPSGPGLSHSRINGSNFCGGIVGRVTGEGNVIESCTMSGWFHYGNQYNGGIVGNVAPDGILNIRNTLFDGKFEMGAKYQHGWYAPYGFEYDGPKPVKCSPFVGWNEGILNVADSYYAGFADTKKNHGCNVIVGETNTGAKTTVDNCYYIINGDELDKPDGTFDAKELEVLQIDKELGAMWQLSDDQTTVKPYLVVEDFQGEGTSANPYLVSSEHNWRQFIYHTKYYGDSYDNKVWKQTNDITTTKWGAYLNGSNDAIYDGDQHTLTLDVETTKSFAAPFSIVDHSIVKNLKVSGSVKGGIHTAGLIGQSSQLTQVENCLVDAHITFGGNSTNNAHGGGLIGHCFSGPLRLTDCAFTGKLTAIDNGFDDGTWAGGIVGWGDSNAHLILNSCFELGEFDGVKNADFFWRYNPSGDDNITLTQCCYVNGQTTDAAKVCSIGDKEALKDVQNTSHTSYPFLGIDLYIMKEGSPALCYLTYGDNVYLTKGVLFDNIDNTRLFEMNKGEATDITIYGRTLYKDGSWNTLCLPFSVTQKQMEADDCPLKGATIKTLETSGFNEETGTLTLNFRGEDEMKAHTPYIVKWDKPTDTDEIAVIVNPLFKGVSIEDPMMPGMLPYVDTDDVQFIGLFKPKALEANNRTILYMGSDNKLYYPSVDMNLNAFRCYFKLVFLTAGDPNPTSVKNFVLDFGDGETTGIRQIENGKQTMEDAAFYDLSGRRLNGKPTQKGIYIYNGKKFTVK